MKQSSKHGENSDEPIQQNNRRAADRRRSAANHAMQTLEKEGIALPHTENASGSAVLLIRPKICRDPITKTLFPTIAVDLPITRQETKNPDLKL
jgi:hypothetical protein